MPVTGGSMKRFLSEKMEVDCEDPASHNSVKTHLSNIALGNPLTDEDHNVLPSRSMKLSLSAECVDRNEKQIRNLFYTALHSIQEKASLSNISLEVSDSFIGSKSWTPRYHEGHLYSLRRCHLETYKADSACYFYIMWLSDYGELELPSRISRQLLDSVRQNLPSMLEQENRIFELLLAPYTTDSVHSNFVRLLSPHEFKSSYQEFEQIIHNAWLAMIAFAFHASVPLTGDHPLLQLRNLMKSRLHFEFEAIQAAYPNCTHTKFIYRMFSEEEEIERLKKIKNEQRHLNDAKRPPYHETREHVEELTDKDVCRFFYDGIPYGSVKKRVRDECTHRYNTLLRDSIAKYGSQAIAVSVTNDKSLATLQESFQSDFERYVTSIIHSLSSIASENVYRGMSLHWKENSRILHSQINFACRKEVLDDLTDTIVRNILNPTNEVQSNLSLKVLISGPSGSGKSTFLAAAAKMLSRTLSKRSLIAVRYIKMDPSCKTVVGLLQSISAQIALLVPGSLLHAQMSANQHLDELSASIVRFCAPTIKSIADEEKIRFVLLIDDFDLLDSDAVELLDSWIPVGFHPHFSIIATTGLNFMDEKLSFLRKAGLKREHTIIIPPFDANVRSALINGSTTRANTEQEQRGCVEDMASIMANTGIFITNDSRPQTSASVSISLHSGKHESLSRQSFSDSDICQSLYDIANSISDLESSNFLDSLAVDDIAENVLQSASDFKSFELAFHYLQCSTLNSVPKHVSTASFIQKTLNSASEEFGIIFISHLMAYITFSRDPIQRCELLALLTCDEEVILEARNKNHDLYSGSTSVKFPSHVLNSFLDNCTLLQVMLPQRGEALVCDCALLIAAWCCSQKGFDHKFIHSNMAIYFLGVWSSDGFPSQPLEQVLPPAPDSINFRRIREGPYHAILAGEFTLAAQEVARYTYIETCYRHGQGQEAAYYLKLLAGYIHSDPLKFSDTELPKRVNDYWIFVHCNHHKLCLNVMLLSNMACSTNASSKMFEDAVANLRHDVQWSNRTKGFRLPRNSSIDNMRCCRNLPNVQGVPSVSISSNHRFAFVADNGGFLHKCELFGQRSHSKSFLFAMKRLLAICCDKTGSSVMIMYIDEVMRATDIPESEAHINAHTCNLFTEWPQSVCISSLSGASSSLILKTSTAGLAVHSMTASSALTSVNVGGLNFTDDFLSQCGSSNMTAIRSTVSIVSDAECRYVLGSKDRVLEIYKESKMLQAITMDRPILCIAIAADGSAACSLIIGSQVDIFTPDRAGMRWSHNAKLHFVSTVTRISVSSGCLYMMTALDNGCVQVWSVFEKKQRNRTNIALENSHFGHLEGDVKSALSRSFVDDGPMQNLISHGSVLHMAFIEENGGFVSVIFDSSGSLGEWTFPNEYLKHPIAVISNRPGIPVYSSLSFNCGLSSAIVWANVAAGMLTTLSSSGDMCVTSLNTGTRVAKTLLSSNFRINCVSVVEPSEFALDLDLKFVLGYQDGCIRLISRTWSCEFEGKVHHAAVTCIDTVARTHRTISLIGFVDASLVMFDVSARTRICMLPKQHTSPITCVQMYKDTGLSLGQDRQITIWDLTLRRVKMTVSSISNVVACSFALSSTLLYSVSDDSKLRVHSTESHKERFSFYVNPKPTCMHVLQSGNKIVCGHQNGDVIVYNVQRRLIAFKLEGHVSSVSSVFFVLDCPLPMPADDCHDSNSQESVKEFAMILSCSNDMSAILWSPLLSSYQLQLWNSSVTPQEHIEANSLAINRSPAQKKGSLMFPHTSAPRGAFKELPESTSHADVAIIQKRVKNCMRFANIRLGLIPEMPVIAIDSAKDVEKECQSAVSIFQAKSTQKLGKHTRQLVSLSLASFNQGVIPTRSAESTLAGGARCEKERTVAILSAVSPLGRSLRSLPPLNNSSSRHSSPSQWIAEQDQPSSDDDS